MTHRGSKKDKHHISITNKDIQAIFNARKSLLYYNDKPWIKKEESNFDDTMSAYDGAAVYDLTVIFMLSPLNKHISKNHTGQHRDGGLAILKNVRGPQAKK